MGGRTSLAGCFCCFIDCKVGFALGWLTDTPRRNQWSWKALAKCSLGLGSDRSFKSFFSPPPDFNQSFCKSPRAPLCLFSGIQGQDSTDLFAISAARQIKLVPSRAPFSERSGGGAGAGTPGFGRSLRHPSLFLQMPQCSRPARTLSLLHSSRTWTGKAE